VSVNKSGFTLIELMVAMVIGLTAITSVYSLGSAMSKQFYEEQRLATAQGASRVAIMELRRDISRAGLFGTPARRRFRSSRGERPPWAPSNTTPTKINRWSTPTASTQMPTRTDCVC
jgi:prepilin-type N-terminal cleavage/methylation domain-containing protein